MTITQIMGQSNSFRRVIRKVNDTRNIGKNESDRRYFLSMQVIVTPPDYLPVFLIMHSHPERCTML